MTKRETISRVRGLVKGEKQDAFLTDRFIYSTILKCAKLFVKRLDDNNKLMRYSQLFEPLGIDLKDVSTVEAGCIDIPTCCSIKRSEKKLPKVFEASWGPIFRYVSSIDGSQEIHRTYQKQYVKMARTTTFKYNKARYYWLSDGYAYFPNLDWDMILIDGMWEDSIEIYKCDATSCVSRLDENTHIPEDLFAEIEKIVIQELLGMVQLPKDNLIDNQSQLRN